MCYILHGAHWRFHIITVSVVQLSFDDFLLSLVCFFSALLLNFLHKKDILVVKKKMDNLVFNLVFMFAQPIKDNWDSWSIMLLILNNVSTLKSPSLVASITPCTRNDSKMTSTTDGYFRLRLVFNIVSIDDYSVLRHWS